MLPTRLLFAATLFLIPATGLMAQSPQILNPGFESDSFTTAPGYAVENGGSISAWSHTGAVGLSPAAGDASFADNGAIPEGGGVAFLRSNGTPATLSTTITGLLPGTRYTVRFRANCSDGQAGSPAASWSLNDGPYAAFRADIPVGAANPYRIITGSFVATAATAQLVMKNDSGSTDSTLLLDDFSVATDTPPGWGMHPWTDDASLGLDPARTMWVVDSVEMGAPIVGPGSYPIEPEVWGKFTQSGFWGTRDDQNEILSNYYANPVFPWGQSYYLAARCCWGMDPVAITLTHLKAGGRYRVTFYGSNSFHSSQAQLHTLSDPSGSFSIDQSVYGPGRSFRIERDFIARGQTHDIRIEPHSGEWWAFHLNGIALQSYQPLVEISPTTDQTLLSQALNAPAVSRAVKIRNPGPEVLHLSSMTLEGPHASQFRLSTGTLPADLLPGGEMSCTLTYHPDAYGQHPASLRVVVANPLGANLELAPFLINGFAWEPFAAWSARLFGPDAGNPAIAGPDADPDGDGQVNFLEYGLRGDPQVSSGSPLLLPVASTAGKASIRFTLPLPAKNYQLHVILQHSSDLRTWTDLYEMGTTSKGSTSYGPRTWDVYTSEKFSDKVQVDISSDDPRVNTRPGFWRLKVE